MIAELTDMNRNLMMSIDVIPVPTDEAVREVENRLLGVETNITNWQRRQNANNNFSAVVPYDMEQQRKESKEFLDDLTTRDQIITLIEATKQTPIHMQVLFAVLLGLRRCEINGVKYSDIDYINWTLRVQRQLGKKPNTTAEDFPAKTFTKQEIGLKTSSSYCTIPIPDYVFEAILEERKTYEKNRRHRPAAFQDLDYICCSSYGRPRSKDFHWTHYKKLLRENGLPGGIYGIT